MPLYYNVILVWLLSLDPRITPHVGKAMLDAHIVWHSNAHEPDSQVDVNVCKWILIHDVERHVGL